MNREIVKLTRAQLYEQVWITPIRKLAPQYGLSDVGLAKICKKLDIPRPPVGYWAKKEVGKAPARPKLPDADEHGDDLIGLFVPSESEQPREYQFHDSTLAKLYDKELHCFAPEIPTVIRPQHRIAHQSKRWFIEKAKREASREKTRDVRNWPERPNRPADALGLDVSLEILDRVARLISGIEKAAKERGYRCGVCADDPRSLEIEALGTQFSIRIREKLRQVKHELCASAAPRRFCGSS